MSTLLYVLEVAVALGVVVCVHELGHLVTAKWFGVWVRRFSIGFGPPIWLHRKGDTEYSIRAVPIGGFVEPMGDHPDNEGGDSPRALWRRPAWQRAVVFSAGVVMNALFAVVLFAAAFLIGVKVETAEVGDLLPGSPAEAAGLKPGDRIVEIDGWQVDSFLDAASLFGLSDAETEFQIVLERPVEGGDGHRRVGPLAVRSRRSAGEPIPTIGYRPARESVIGERVKGCLAARAGLKLGDRILSVNGRPVDRWRDLADAVEEAPPGPIALRIERQGQAQDLEIDPAKLRQYESGIRVPTAIVGVQAGSPAGRAGVKAGDLVASAGGVAWPTAEELAEAVKAVGQGADVRLSLWRDGQTEEVACRPEVSVAGDPPRIGIMMGVTGKEPPCLGGIEPDSAAEQAGLRPGDVVLTIGGDKVRNLAGLFEALAEAEGKAVTLGVKRGGAELAVPFRQEPVTVERFTLEGVGGRVLLDSLPRIYNPLKAAAKGMRRTVFWFGRIYANLRQLIRGEVSTQTVGGPVLIVQRSLQVAARGPGTLIHLWGILSVCFAVFNFLPVPPFDGGHVVFVVVEKLKGGPVSLRTRNGFWIAGWIAVGILFLLITYQDVVRLVTAW